MKPNFFYFIILVFVFFSCKEEEDPQILLDGAYQFSLPESEFTGVISIIMTFKKNGTLLSEGFTNSEDEDNRCLSGFRVGNYTLVGEKLTIEWTSAYGPDPAIDFTLDCVPKESFVSILSPNQPASEGILIFENGQNAFTLQYPCNDTGNCIGAMYFAKVE